MLLYTTQAAARAPEAAARCCTCSPWAWAGASRRTAQRRRRVRRRAQPAAVPLQQQPRTKAPQALALRRARRRAERSRLCRRELALQRQRCCGMQRRCSSCNHSFARHSWCRWGDGAPGRTQVTAWAVCCSSLDALSSRGVATRRPGNGSTGCCAPAGPPPKVS